MNAKGLGKLAYALSKQTTRMERLAQKDLALRPFAEELAKLRQLAYRLAHERELIEARKLDGAEVLYTVFDPGAENGLFEGMQRIRTPRRYIRTYRLGSTPPEMAVPSYYNQPYGTEDLERCWPATDLAAVRRRTDRTMPAWGKRLFAEVAA